MKNDEKRIREQAFREIRYGGPEGIKQKAKQNKAKTAAKITALVFLGIVAAGAGLGWKMLHNISGGKGVISVIEGFKNPRGQFPNKDRVNVLLIGKDYNRAKDGMPFTKGSRSDSIMLLSLDLENKKVSALSIPRDTYIRPYVNIRTEYGPISKINATYALGGEKMLRDTVEKVIGVRPDYFIAIKPDAVKEIVDALGGVEVETIDRMKYDDSWGQLHVELPKGKQTINGTQAIGFARYREADIYERTPDGRPIYTGRKDSNGNPIFKQKARVEHSKEEGDPQRMARQRQLIRAMASKGKSYTNLFQLDKIVETGLGQIETDMDRKQIFALASLFRTIQPEQMQTGTLPGEGTKRGSWIFLVDEKRAKAMVDWLVRGDEDAANQLTVVAVQNGTGVPGAASRVRDRLRKEGFDARNDGNAKRDTTDDLTATRIVFHTADMMPRAKRIADLLGGGTLVKEPLTVPDDKKKIKSDKADVIIVLGRDLAEQFGSQSASR
jgi:polyisoprenyl-teichoic acid--peptidoglycan teichoic acid transferase